EAALETARPAARRRYVLFGGRLRRAPQDPPTLLTTDLLSAAGKLRLLLEPFAEPAAEGREETVWEFAARRAGRETADRLVDAAVSGISAGDSRELSLSASFPAMLEMEREHGSLLFAMMRRGRGPRPRIVSFGGGLGILPEELARRLGPRLRTGRRAQALVRAHGAWEVRLEGGQALAADRVVL